MTGAWEGLEGLRSHQPLQLRPPAASGSPAGTGGSSAAQNAPGPAPGREKAAIQRWLGQEPGDERQEPGALQRKEPLRGLPVGLSCQAGRPGQLTREGEVPGRED